jgi:phosphoheptose isomerase
LQHYEKHVVTGKIFQTHKEDSGKMVNTIPTAAELGKRIRESIQNGGKVLICGNGGSASQADHFQGELLADGLPCIALTNIAPVTAIANDDSFDLVFGIQILALGNPGDILICLTTSNESANILYATKCGQQRGMDVYTLTGSNEPKDCNSQVVALASGCTTQYIQERTIEYLHRVWEAI